MADTSSLRRGFVEAVLIVLSILLAFAIDAWWDGRQALRVEKVLLEAVADELAENRSNLDQTLSLHEAYRDRVDRFLRASSAELASLPGDSVLGWTQALSVPATFDPGVAATSALLETPPANSVAGAEARVLLAQWLRALDDLKEEANLAYDVGGRMFERLSYYAAPGAPDGLRNIPPMIARLGPGVLAQLRSDEEFVAATIAYAHFRSVYLAELRRASELLDTISEAVGAGAL